MTAVEQFFKDLCDLGFIEYPDDSLVQDRFNLALEMEKEQIKQAQQVQKGDYCAVCGCREFWNDEEE